MRHWTICGAMIAVWLVPLPSAEPCSCAPLPPRWYFEHADLVVIGTVEDVRIVSEWQVEMSVAVVQGWKGTAVDCVTVRTTRDGGSCGYGPPAGETHLFHLKKASESPEYITSLCSGNRTYLCSYDVVAEFPPPDWETETWRELPSFPWGTTVAVPSSFAPCVTRPAPLSRWCLAWPNYSDEGAVFYQWPVRLTIGADGMVVSAIPVHPGYAVRLDQQLAEAAKAWRFAPATYLGQPIASIVEYPIGRPWHQNGIPRGE